MSVISVIFARILTWVYVVTNAWFARRGHPYRLIGLYLPIAPAPAAISHHRVMTTWERRASNAEIVEAIDSMRSVLAREQTHVSPAGELTTICCDCGLAHRYRYTLIVNERGELRLAVTISGDHALGEGLRGVYEFPYKRPQRPRGGLLSGGF